jgi:WD40 repeat protein
MAAKVFWLALFLAASVERAQAQSDQADPQQRDAAGAPATSPAANQTANEGPLPAGALARFGTTRFRPYRSGQAVSFLPDGATLVQTTSSGHLEYWDARSGRLLRDPQIAKPYVTAAHAPNGKFVALRGGHIDEAQGKRINWVALVEVETAQERMRLELDDRRSQHLAVSANGSTIAVDGEKIHIIDTAAKAVVLALDFARREATALALSPDGQTLAIGERNNLTVWQWSAGGEPRTIPIAADAKNRVYVTSLEFSPDGATLAVGADRVGGDAQRGPALVNVATGKTVRELSVAGVRYWYVRGLAWSQDGKLLAAPLERDASPLGVGAVVWKAATGEVVQKLQAPHGYVSSLSFSPDNKLLAGANSYNPQLCVWDLETGERLGAALPGHAYPPSSIRFFPDEDRLATASDDATIRLWKLSQPEEVRILEPQRDPSDQTRWIRALDISPDGKLIASSSLDNTVRIWNADTGRELYALPGNGDSGGRRSVRFTPDNERLIAWGDDMHVNTWDVRTGKAVNEYRAQPSGVKLPAESDVGRDLFGAADGLFQLDGGLISPDASRLLVRGGHMHIFDVATGKEVARFDRTVGVNIGLAISPDNQYTITSSWGQARRIPLQGGGAHITAERDHLVHLRKLADGTLITETKLPGGGIGEAAFSPDSRRTAITIADDNPRVLILSVPELKEIASIAGLRGRANALEFSRSGKRLAVTDADTTVLVYDLEKLSKKDRDD